MTFPGVWIDRYKKINNTKTNKQTYYPVTLKGHWLAWEHTYIYITRYQYARMLGENSLALGPQMKSTGTESPYLKG